MSPFDIIARLERSPAAWVCIRREAADEIRKLRAEIERLTAERGRLREALEMADRLLTSHAIASGKYWRKPFATRHEMKHGKIRAALKETSK